VPDKSHVLPKVVEKQELHNPPEPPKERISEIIVNGRNQVDGLIRIRQMWSRKVFDCHHMPVQENRGFRGMDFLDHPRESDVTERVFGIVCDSPASNIRVASRKPYFANIQIFGVDVFRNVARLLRIFVSIW